jgi:phage gp29-like protein
MAQLIDQYGNPLRKTQMTSEQAAPNVASVRRPYGNHQASGLTPPKLARILREAVEGDPERYLELAEDMEERNEHYAGVLGVRKRQVSGLEITVESPSDDADDVAATDLVRDFIDRDDLEDELFDILDALGKSFSATEILWDTSEGQWTIDALKWRDPRWFTFDRTDGETLRLRGVSGDEDLWPAKWIVHRAKIKSGLTIRGGLARSAAWAYLFKTFTASDWSIFCEAYGQPLRLGKYGPNASKDDKEKLMQAVSSIAADFAAIVPEGMAIEFIQASLAGSLDLYERRADWLDRQITKLVLGQTATTEAQAGGYAVGKVHDGVRDDIERADARQLAATLNRDLVVPLVSLNLGPRKKYPRIKIGRPDETDVNNLVSNVVKLVPFGLKVGMSTMRDKLGLPDPDKDEELLVPQAAASNTTQQDQADTSPPILATQSQLVQSKHDAIDAAAARITADSWQEMTPPVVDGLAEALDKATSVEDAQAILARQISAMGVNAFVEKLARAAFSARISGEADEALS